MPTITGSSAIVSGSAVSTNNYNYGVTTSGTSGLRTTALSGTTKALTSSYARGIRLMNGGSLPSGGTTNTSGGLTIASPNPVYIQGDFNTGSTLSGSFSSSRHVNQQPTRFQWHQRLPLRHFGLPSEISGTYVKQPAVIAADAVTILSNNWADSASNGSPMNFAANTTINTAIVAGNVPTAFVDITISPATTGLQRRHREFSPPPGRLVHQWQQSHHSRFIRAALQ